MVRVPCCEKMGLKKGPWTPEEDHILMSFVQQHGHENWRALPKLAGLLRCGKSCRLRWTNYLRPDIKRGNFSKDEEDEIIKLHQILGNRWAAIANRLPGRTDNDIKNYWHTHLKKRVQQNLAAQRMLRFSSALGRVPESRDVSNHPAVHLGNCYYKPEGTLPGCFVGSDYCISASGSQTMERMSVRDTPKSNKIVGAVDLRQQLLSAGESRNDGAIKDDMVFWYNLFVNAGKPQAS